MLFKNLKAFILVEDEKAEAYSHYRSCVKSIKSEDNVDFNNQRKCFLPLSQMGILRQRVFSVVSNCLEPTKLSSVSPTVPKMPRIQSVGCHWLWPWPPFRALGKAHGWLFNPSALALGLMGQEWGGTPYSPPRVPTRFTEMPSTALAWRLSHHVLALYSKKIFWRKLPSVLTQWNGK